MCGGWGGVVGWGGSFWVFYGRDAGYAYPPALKTFSVVDASQSALYD